jgi:hypothetical protein
MHTELENYLAKGTPLKSPIVQVGVPHLPQPKAPGIMVEKRFRFEDPRLPVHLVGIVDLVEPDLDRITDHKTTSNFQYAKSEEMLRVDPQAIIYMKWALSTFGERDIRFRHIYYRTKGKPSSRVTEVELSPAEIEAQFNNIVTTVQEMHGASRLEVAAAVTPMPNSCGDYGGCPFVGDCAVVGDVKHNAFRKFPNNKENKMKEKTDAIQRLLARRKQQSAGTEPVPAEQPEITEIEAKQPITVNPPDGFPMDTPAEMPKKKPGRKAKGPTLNGRSLNGFKRDELARELPALFARLREAEAIHPVLESLSESVRNYYESDFSSADPKRKDMLNDVPRIIALLEGEPMEKSVAVVQKADPAPEPETLEICGVTYTEVEEPKTQTVTTHVGPTGQQPLVSTQEDEIPFSVEGLDGTSHLYINCVPRGVTPVHFEEIVFPLMQEVARDAAVPHYSMIPYAEGPKRVAALLAQKLLNEEIILPEHLVCDRRNPVTNACLEVLIPQVHNIIEGMC